MNRIRGCDEENQKLNRITPYVWTVVNVIWDYIIGVKDIKEIPNLRADLKRMEFDYVRLCRPDTIGMLRRNKMLQLSD